MDIFDIVVNCLENGSHGVLATVVKRAGSAPRDVGAKMLVVDDGRIFGTVGGGQLESNAYDKAREIMGKEATFILNVNMDATKIEGEDMLCGGNVDILLEPVTERHRNVYEAARRCREDKGPAVIFTHFGAGLFAKSLIRGDGTVVGDPVDQEEIDRCVDSLRRREPELHGNAFAEPVGVIVPLYIFGAGHVSQHLSKIAKIAGFSITVIDDRKEFANAERFPEADNIITSGIRDAFNSLGLTGNEYVVILTRSQESDALALEEVLKRNAKYVGMMGSARKVGIIMDRLHEKGFHRKVTAGVHAPVGIDIDAEAPQEVAVSIVAELIKVKNAK